MRYLAISVLTLAALAAAGCVSSRPVHYYTLQAPPVPDHPSNASGPTILVGAVSTPEALQDGRIRYRAGANEIGAYEYHRWLERPGIMVRDSLLRALSASGRYRVREAGSGVAGDYLIRGKLSEFGEVDNPAVKTRISIHLELIDRKTGNAVWERLLEREEPAAGKTMPDVVQSMERNLRQILNQAVAEMDTFLAAGRGA